jgi:hypothetical protein
VSSRLAVDGYGRLVAEGTCVELQGLRWLVIDTFEIFTPPGRAPTAQERMSARPPYESNSAKRARRERVEVPDELLADQEAVELARREQQREPFDLISRAAA